MGDSRAAGAYLENRQNGVVRVAFCPCVVHASKTTLEDHVS